MNLVELGLKESRLKTLEKKKLISIEDVQCFYPRKYYDFTKAQTLTPGSNGKYIAVIGMLTKVKSKKTNNVLMLQAKVMTDENIMLNVQWIGSYYLKSIISEWENERVIVCGELSYMPSYKSYHMNNPIVFDRNIKSNLRIHTVYTKFDKISDDWMRQLIAAALTKQRKENIPESLIQKYKLLDINQAIQVMHNPTYISELENARKRLVYDKLLLFASRIEERERIISKGTIYNAKTMKSVYDIIQNLPFTLSDGQKNAFESMKTDMVNGKRVNALIQGDVGSGKTIVAFLLMMLMADSGYQSVLMAPTQVLAKQHFKELNNFAMKYGYQAAFLSSELSQKERKQVLSGIKNGTYQLIVGTHSVANEKIEYKNLALTITDEEHKFGIAQKNILLEKAQNGTHCIIMSATPIPRTMANVMYGNSISVYDFKPPAERQKVQTAIFNNDSKIFEFLHKEIMSGRQCYVICSSIKNTGEKMKDILSVEQTERMYQKYFASYPDINIGVVTGKMSTAEMNEVIEKFEKNEIQILISTTVIEVGVNIPNASVIVINNAERFGLSQMHQLRGRVGRGKDKAYCILKSADKDNMRLKALVDITDGYEIAKVDLEQRGTGDILGYSQSGDNEYIDLMLKYPNMFKMIQKDAAFLADIGYRMEESKIE